MIRQLQTLCKNPFSALVSEVAKESGVTAYLVGGGLRDLLLGRQAQDLDFVVDKDVQYVAATFSSQIEGRFFWLDEQRCQARVVKKAKDGPVTFDFALQRGYDIIEDLSLRDFTINSLALPLVDDASDIIDPLNGIADLKLRSIRACSETSFDEDPLRLLRAFRLAATFDFHIESDTFLAINEKARLLQEVAPERIRDELFCMLGMENAGTSLAAMRNAGVLDVIIEYYLQQKYNLVTIQQQINNVLQVELITSHPQRYFREGTRIMEYLTREVESGVTIGGLLKLAVFVGTLQVAEMTPRLKLGSKALRILEKLIVMVPPCMEPGWNPTERAMYRFLVDHEPAAIALLIIAISRNLLHRQVCSSIVEYYFSEYPSVPKEQLLKGEDIMKIFGICEGKAVGEAIESLNHAERMGIVTTREEAIEYLTKKLLTKNEPVI